METATRINDTIVCEIDIDAPPERVFQAWIDPEQRLAWWGDSATYRCSSMDSDLRVGGKWITHGRGMEGKDFTVQGHYTRIEPPRVLGVTWNHDWSDTPTPETHVLIELTPTSSGTHVTVTHSGFTDAPSRERHNHGWIRVRGWLRGELPVSY
jgi:uncharacterized protein YndB with AHSA1/START domain